MAFSDFSFLIFNQNICSFPVVVLFFICGCIHLVRRINYSLMLFLHILYEPHVPPLIKYISLSLKRPQKDDLFLASIFAYKVHKTGGCYENLQAKMATQTQLFQSPKPPPPLAQTPPSKYLLCSNGSRLTSSSIVISTIPAGHNARKWNHVNIPLASFRNNSSSETGECPVPLEQQPINEYKSLSNSFPFSWASADFVEYFSRLFVTGAAFTVLVGLPVAWFGSVGPDSDPIELAMAGVSSGILVVTLLVVRMYLGWAYVGNRLLSATVEYEETGWYDGQMWVKTAEVLARDRLLGSFSVKPVLSRLKNSLVTLAVSLFICVLLFLNAESGHKDAHIASDQAGGRAVPGVYKDESARTFEPDAFCGEPAIL